MSIVAQRASVLVLVLAISLPPGAVHALPCWYPPVAAPVTDPFREPACAWCPGNRGIEFGTRPGDAVRAAATGHVTYAGSIAGTVYVVVRHGDGRRVTYGNLQTESYDVDDLVVRGQVVGRAAGRLHLGARDGERYVDPAPFLGRLVRPPRLIPVDGRPGNPAPPARLTCRTSSNRRVARIHWIAGSPTGELPPNQPLVPQMRSPRRPERDGQPQQGEQHGCHQHASDVGSWSPFRAPDPSLEPEDASLHLR